VLAVFSTSWRFTRPDSHFQRSNVMSLFLQLLFSLRKNRFPCIFNCFCLFFFILYLRQPLIFHSRPWSPLYCPLSTAGPHLVSAARFKVQPKHFPSRNKPSLSLKFPLPPQGFFKQFTALGKPAPPFFFFTVAPRSILWGPRQPRTFAKFSFFPARSPPSAQSPAQTHPFPKFPYFFLVTRSPPSEPSPPQFPFSDTGFQPSQTHSMFSLVPPHDDTSRLFATSCPPRSLVVTTHRFPTLPINLCGACFTPRNLLFNGLNQPLFPMDALLE